jgi:hypothetical protein
MHPHPIYLRIILTLYSHLRPTLPNGPLPSDFPRKICEFLTPPMRAACSTHLIVPELGEHSRN